MTEETNNPGGTDPETPGEDELVGDPELPPGGSTTPTDPEPTEEGAARGGSGDPELPPG